jgi:hypothetical protein
MLAVKMMAWDGRRPLEKTRGRASQKELEMRVLLKEIDEIAAFTRFGRWIEGRAVSRGGQVGITPSNDRKIPHETADWREDRASLPRRDGMADLGRRGAGKAGTNPEVDSVMGLNPRFGVFLAQKKDKAADLSEAYDALFALPGNRKGKA